MVGLPRAPWWDTTYPISRTFKAGKENWGRILVIDFSLIQAVRFFTYMGSLRTIHIYSLSLCKTAIYNLRFSPDYNYSQTSISLFYSTHLVGAVQSFQELRLHHLQQHIRHCAGVRASTISSSLNPVFSYLIKLLDSSFTRMMEQGKILPRHLLNYHRKGN